MKTSHHKTGHTPGTLLSAIPGRFRTRLVKVSRRQALALLIGILLLNSNLLVRVRAADGDLDLSFDGDGKVVTGFVDEPTLAALYAGATCLLHPALYEGFGLTPLESLAAGTPVVAYDVGAVREVVGDAGLLVDAAAPLSLADALVALLGNKALARSLSANAPARVAMFSWDRAAEETISVYRTLV